MRSSYDRNIFTNSNIYNNNINSSRSFFGNSSKLENLQNLYFSLNPYAKSTSTNANNQLKLLNQFQDTEENALDKKYGKPIINNYKRFHLKAEEMKKGKGKSLDKNTLYTNYTPEAKNNPNLAFYSLADLSMLHPITYQKMKTTERYLTSGNLKNNTRLQMVDEKLKKLEEKNEYLQTINNIFFDSIKDNLTQSLKRKAFLRKHLKDIEYLKQINLDEYNDKVKYLMNLVEQGEIDFDNYNFEGEPLNGVENLAGRIEALKTEIGTMLTKNTIKNDLNLNFLKQDVIKIRDELEKKLMEFSDNNNKNYELLKEYLFREEKDRLAEKRKKKRAASLRIEEYIQEKGDKFEIKGTKPQIQKEEEEEEKESTENIEESEVSTETNKNIDVIDKLLLDTISLSMTTNGKNVKSVRKSDKTKKSKKDKDKNLEEREIGTMLTKNTIKNDLNLNFLKQDVIKIRDELEKKLMEFSDNNNKNYELLKEYLFREEKDRLAEKRKKKRAASLRIEEYIQEKGDNIEIKGAKQQIKKEEEEEEKESTENIEESEVSTETNKNIDVIDKLPLDTILYL